MTRHLGRRVPDGAAVARAERDGSRGGGCTTTRYGRLDVSAVGIVLIDCILKNRVGEDEVVRPSVRTLTLTSTFLKLKVVHDSDQGVYVVDYEPSLSLITLGFRDEGACSTLKWVQPEV